MSRRFVSLVPHHAFYLAFANEYFGHNLGHAQFSHGCRIRCLDNGARRSPRKCEDVLEIVVVEEAAADLFERGTIYVVWPWGQFISEVRQYGL
jgi:hypothetical protein